MPEISADLFYAQPAKAYLNGKEVRILSYLSNGLVRVRIIATGEVKDVRKNQVTLG